MRIQRRKNDHGEGAAKGVLARRKNPDERRRACGRRQQKMRRFCGQVGTLALQVLDPFLKPTVEAGPQERTSVDSDKVALGGNFPKKSHCSEPSRHYL
jgi:hypothetical protein